MANAPKAKPPKGGIMSGGFRVLTNRRFVDERILVDGCNFDNCEFVDCMLVFTATKPFILTGKGAPFIEFAGAAQNTLDQLRGLHMFGYAPLVERIIDSIRNPNGASLN